MSRPEPCLLEVVAGLSGERTTDRPGCVHPTLGAIARVVHDLSSATGRAALRPLAAGFIGTSHQGFETPARLVAQWVSVALTVAGPETVTANERRRLVAARQTARQLLAARVTARWWFPALDRIGLSEPFYRRVVATEQGAEAVVVIVRAARADRDAWLRQLLVWSLAVSRAGAGIRAGTPVPQLANTFSIELLHTAYNRQKSPARPQ